MWWRETVRCNNVNAKRMFGAIKKPIAQNQIAVAAMWEANLHLSYDVTNPGCPLPGNKHLSH